MRHPVLAPGAARFAAVLAGMGLCAGAALAQAPPLPPERPFDLKLPPGRASVPITPPRAAGDAGPSATGAGGLVAAPLPPTRPETFTLRAPARGAAVASVQQEPTPQAETPPAAPEPPPAQPPSWFPREWPRLTPQQEQKAEPQISDRVLMSRGLSTDPGTSITCLPPRIREVLNQVISRYGGVHVTSTWRPAWRARQGSYHRRCEAVDFRVHGIAPREVLRFVSTLPETGGRKVYWNGLIHVDTGPVRSW